MAEVCSSRAFLIHKWFANFTSPDQSERLMWRQPGTYAPVNLTTDTEINERMRIRLTWLLGVIVLVSVGFLMACGSHYSASSDGLLIVPSQGSDVMQSFSFNLSNGHTAQISTAPAVVGKPVAVVLDPSGAFAYVAIVPDPAVANSVAAIASYKINSDGTLAAGATPVPMNTVGGAGGAVAPAAITIDSSGKFLFVADQATTASGSVVAGTVSVFSVSSGTVSEVSGSPFAIPVPIGGTTPSALSLAVTPTVFPAANAVCSPPAVPPTSEFLYVGDEANNDLLEYSVDMSSGALALMPALTTPGISTGSEPSGVTVDPCNRFVYVANQNSNNVSAFSILSGSPVVTGSPFSAGNGPGPIAVDPFGNFVYVVNTLSNTLSGFKISPVTGALTPLNPATLPTGTTPNSIAIRGDGNWLFVANTNSASVSQYAITPASGALAPQGSITTDNFPMGVAVK
jgi:6-phosphogluconolactonase (cycloisomerase 2 family)